MKHANMHAALLLCMCMYKQSYVEQLARVVAVLGLSYPNNMQLRDWDSKCCHKRQ